MTPAPRSRRRTAGPRSPASVVPIGPRYQQVADQLKAQIESGDYPIGSRLPTEMELAEHYQISRHTVREALRQLREAGLITRRRRAGTEVVARTPPASYRQPTNSIRDFLQYAENARLSRLRTIRISCTPALAHLLECQPGHSWLRVTSLRNIPGDPLPICLTTAYVDTDLVGIDQRLDRLDGPISALLEQVYGVRIARIDQAIDAVRLTREQARLLQTPAGGPALRAVRRYYDERGRLLELSTALHPGDRFSYITSLVRS